MLMSDLTHRSLACKAHLNILIENALYKFITITRLGREVSNLYFYSKQVTWTNYLYFLLGSLPIWPSREQVNKTMPRSFQDAFPTVRVIIDCTEIKVQTPSSLTLHSEFYSNHKSATLP